MLMQRSFSSHDCRDVQVPLPPALQHLGATTGATLTGDPDGPVVVVLGGISGNRFVCPTGDGNEGWWRGLVGAGCALDPRHYRILGIDFAADANGRIAPSTREQAEVICAALDALGIDRARAIVGASYGGMVALSLAQNFPDRVEKLVVISAGAEPHSAATAVRELQRRVVALGIANGDSAEALSIARGMAMLTYRTQQEFAGRFTGGLPDHDPLGTSEPGAYLRSRGKAFQDVMSPERFLSLSASIDRHAVDPSRIDLPILLIGANSDQLVPAEQMISLAEQLGDNAELHLLDSLYGHDMFLKEAGRIGALVSPFLVSE